MTVLCVNSNIVYSDITSADAAEGGTNFGVPTRFEQTGISSADVGFSVGDYPSLFIYTATSGEETTGVISVGAQCTGVIRVATEGTVSNLRTRVVDLKFSGSGNTILDSLVMDGSGSNDVVDFQPDLNYSFNNLLIYNVSEGFRSSSTNNNAIATNCTVVDASGFGVLRPRAVNAVSINTSSDAYLQVGASSLNYWADDGTGSDAITEGIATDIFEDYASGDYRIKASSSPGVAGAGAFINIIAGDPSRIVTLSGGGSTPTSIFIGVDFIATLQGGGTLTSIPFINIDLTAIIPGGGNLSAIIDSIVTAIAQISGGGVLTSLGAKANLLQSSIAGTGITVVSILKDINFDQNVSGSGILYSASAKGTATTILESLGGTTLTSISINKELTSLVEGGSAGLLIDTDKANAITINTEANGLLISQVLIDKELGLVTISANGNLFVTHIKDFGDSNTILLNLTSIAEATSRQSTSKSIDNITTQTVKITTTIREEDINANT